MEKNRNQKTNSKIENRKQKDLCSRAVYDYLYFGIL